MGIYSAGNAGSHLFEWGEFFQCRRHRVRGENDLLHIGENLLRRAGADLVVDKTERILDELQLVIQVGQNFPILPANS